MGSGRGHWKEGEGVELGEEWCIRCSACGGGGVVVFQTNRKLIINGTCAADKVEGGVRATNGDQGGQGCAIVRAKGEGGRNRDMGGGVGGESCISDRRTL